MIDVEKMCEIFMETNPNPKCELNYINPYTFLVAIILSAQATDKGVNKATPALFEVASTPQDMIDLGIENLKSYIKTIGLFNNKAKSIMAMSEDVIKRFNGELPRRREDLETLAGVGRKTANVLLNDLYGDAVVAVDTHVLRLSKRLGLSNSDKPLQVEKDLLKVIPNEYHSKISHWLVLHGRYVCKAKKPECENCPLQSICPEFGLKLV
ncbi:MAG: endonuclease III [Alphaproteobacteria bacterium]